ncbi:porin family protein [Flavobacterium sp. Fl-318]|uniref:Porin family protein n=1 Tax=Flavobacterium cupriresistens TaxID=2893885 RepID=A0ABU4RD66_9FLAO|nr:MULTISPECIES: porin family protein [unclassified Flavobacterium]MDX6190512.1 porin family protein [Flavobacterium sp. Fl-318]UFH43572.1 PorT family protein [Flavobacterium sp. F-323]
MRKTVIIALVLFITTITSQAQVKVSPGLRAGTNFSTLSNIEDASFKTDFYVGALVAIKFNKYFTLQPELTYSRQGSEGISYDPQNPYIRSYKKEYELNYLSVGAVAKYHFNGSGFHILGGPSADFKTSDNFKQNEFDPIDFDLSIIGGFGYSLPNGLTFEARIKQGLIDIYGYNEYQYNNNNNNNRYDDAILNQVFQIGVSYTFKMK